jgi:hypothetical protein
MMDSPTFLLNTVKIKSLNKLRAALKHNLRENGPDLYFSKRIDPQRQHLNVVLAGAETVDAIMELEKRLVAAGKVGRVKKDGSRARVRSDGVRAIEFLFSLPPNSGVDEDNFFRLALAWLDRYYVPILSCVVHRDEGACHMHAILLPLREGRMIGSSMLGLYTQLQANFHAEVAAQFGLRTLVRHDAATRKAAAQAFMAAIDAQPDLLKNPGLRAWVHEAVERSPARPLELVGLRMPEPQPREKQWVKTMTRPTKSAARPMVPLKPIGFDGTAHYGAPTPKTKPLPVLGFMLLPAIAVSGLCEASGPAQRQTAVLIALPVTQADQDVLGDYTRVPDDLPTQWYDERVGEFIEPVAKQTKA